MIGWSQAQLADSARVSRMTVTEFEKGARLPHPNNLAAIRTAPEAAGVEFIPGTAAGPACGCGKQPMTDNDNFDLQSAIREERKRDRAAASACQIIERTASR
jgi:transcriptional regulator with XRE-family HTH domain